MKNVGSNCGGNKFVNVHLVCIEGVRRQIGELTLFGNYVLQQCVARMIYSEYGVVLYDEPVWNGRVTLLHNVAYGVD